MRSFLKIVMALFFCCFLIIASVFAQEIKKKNKVTVDASRFRYVIVHNKIDPKLSPEDEDRRFIEILMKNISFNKKNLTKLFRLIANRFSSPETLFINVFTDIEDIQTPEERDEGILLAFDEKGNEKQVFPTSAKRKQKSTATFTRYKGKMSIIINYESGHSQEIEMKEVK